MTVNELLDHFNFFPDEILYYDEAENIEDVVYILRITDEGKKEYDGNRYNEFVAEYGERRITRWMYRQDNSLDIDMT